MDVTEGRQYERTVNAQLRRLEQECEQFRMLSKGVLRGETPDSATFGLNRWEFQAAVVVAASTVKSAFEQGRINVGDIQAELHKGTRRVAKDAFFQKWAREAYSHPERVRELGESSADMLRADFVSSLSKEIKKQDTVFTKQPPRPIKESVKKKMPV